MSNGGIGGGAQAQSADASQDLENTLYLDLEAGRVVIKLRPDLAPKHVERIKELTREGFYDGLTFHRVIEGFMAQGGDPKGDGTGGSGQKLPAEFSNENHVRGTVSMARSSNPNSADSQFFIVFADAPDLKKAAAEAASAIAFNQGEVCTAGSRLLVQESIRDEFVHMVCDALKSWHPGHPLDPATTCGAIVDQAQLDRVIGYISIGQAEGAKLVQGGKRIMEDTGGLFVEPTVFDGVLNPMRIASEEIGFNSVDEAITIANDSIYGLAAAVWTSNLNTAHKVARALRAGSVWINHYDGGDMTAPFGGFKQSGNGRDKSLHAFDKYTELKATWIALD